MRRLQERQFTPYLGKANRAEELIQWSISKGKDGGQAKYFKLELAMGLTLNFLAAYNEPKLYLHWNPLRHQKYLQQLGQTDKLWLTSYGVCVSREQGNTCVRLLGAGQSSIELWNDQRGFCQQHQHDDVNWLVGMLKFAEEGPLFFDEVECQKELQLVTPLVLGEQPAKRLEEKLPKQKRELNESARAWLLADAIQGELIKQASKQSKAKVGVGLKK